MNQSFSIRQAYLYAWNMLKKNWKFIIPFFFIIIAVQFVFSYFSGEKAPAYVPTIARGIISLVSTVVSFFFMAGMTRTLLNMRDEKPVSLKNVVGSKKDTWKYFKGSFLWVLIFVAAVLPLVLVLFIGVLPSVVNGQVNVMSPAVIGAMIYFFILVLALIYFSIKFTFWSFSLFDKNVKVIEAYRFSSKITKNTFWKLFIFMISGALLNLLGALVFIVGLLITVPLYMFASLYVYNKLVNNALHGPSDKTETTDVVVQPKELEEKND